ncbi:MAG: RNA chaperone Hfq [Firmicutes bacterium]|nr:RNA chaperone Hfq [Candidatus Fermentithermobacillaceae bacterium]
MLSTNNTGNLQDRYLNQMRKNSTPATVYLTNGFQLKGVIIAFDSYTVLMEVEGKQMLLFKHAISTIAPINVATVMDEA